MKTALIEKGFFGYKQTNNNLLKSLLVQLFNWFFLFFLDSNIFPTLFPAFSLWLKDTFLEVAEVSNLNPEFYPDENKRLNILEANVTQSTVPPLPSESPLFLSDWFQPC